jgi:hypothetical protein
MSSGFSLLQRRQISKQIIFPDAKIELRVLLIMDLSLVFDHPGHCLSDWGEHMNLFFFMTAPGGCVTAILLLMETC